MGRWSAHIVIPAKAGISLPLGGRGKGNEIPAFAGMTESRKLHAPNDKPPGFTGTAFSAWKDMAAETRLKRLRFRAWHRGTREADMLVGGYFDRWHESWSDAEAAWFEAFLEEQDVDIIAWATGTAAAPARLQGEMMNRLQDTDYIRHFR